MIQQLPPVYRLRELEGTLVKITKRDRKTGHVREYKPVKTLREAHGVSYLCPVCFWINGGSVGTHGCLHWFTKAKLPDDADPGPGRWNANGHDIDDLTFVAPGSFSVNMVGHWHGYIESGTVKVDRVESTYKKVRQTPSTRKKTPAKKTSKSKRR